MKTREVTDLVEWPAHWGKALGVGGQRSSHATMPHVSEILDRLERDLGVTVNKWEEPDLRMAGELGFTWEQVLEQGFKERNLDAGVADRVGEVARDGIVASPDGVKFDILHEFKAPQASFHSFDLGKKSRWMLQIKSYCYILGLTKVRLWVFCTQTNWNAPQGRQKPAPRIYDIEFLQVELDEHWGVMRQYRDIVLKEKREKHED